MCLCGFLKETVKHYPFLECPLYSAFRKKKLLSFTVCILLTMSESQLISVFLFGAPFPSLKQNIDRFFHVQSFIIESMRFY